MNDILRSVQRRISDANKDASDVTPQVVKAKIKQYGLDNPQVYGKDNFALIVYELLTQLEDKDAEIKKAHTKKKNAEDIVRGMINTIGDDVTREGLIETPQRVIKSWRKLFGGYEQEPKDIMKVFEDGATKHMVVLENIEFNSMCEHHILPFFGEVSIGYIPDGRVVGVSKLARLVEIFSRRLQIQERMTDQIADAIMEHLKPKGVMVIARAKHLCMIARGVEKQNAVMTTSAIRGDFNKLAVRLEFLNLIKCKE